MSNARHALGLGGNLSRDLTLGVRNDYAVSVFAHLYLRECAAHDGHGGWGNALGLNGDFRGDVLRLTVDDLGDDFVTVDDLGDDFVALAVSLVVVSNGTA